jgi:class 3 adenylate cyclase
MMAQANVLADSVQFKTALDDKVQDPATLADVAAEKKAELGLGLFQVAGRQGALLASLAGSDAFPQPRPGRDAKPADAVFAKAVDSEVPADAFGVMTVAGGLFETYTRPIIIRDQVLGALRIGFSLDDTLAGALKEQTGSEVAFVSEGRVLASSLKGVSRAELAVGLLAMQGMAKNAADGIFTLHLGGMPFLGQLLELQGPDGSVAAQLIQLRSRARVLELLGDIRASFYKVLAGLLLVAITLSFVFAGTITRPLRALVEGTRAIERGELDVRIEVTAKDELGKLAESFNQMAAQLREKERVKALFGRYLPKAVAERALSQQGEIQLGGELREVVILFSDIRGFTSLSERLSPTEVVAMLNDYYTRMIDVLFEHDGTLDKTIGDAIMAVFGAPVADPDAVAKALHTALDMMQALRGFNDDRRARGQEAIEIGIGINVGNVVAGNLGSVRQLSYTVIGDEVNLASRLCGSAKPGQILVSEAVQRKAKWSFDFVALDPIRVKNVSQPVQVYELKGVRSAAAPGFA